MRDEMTIKRIVVDEIPDSCGRCWLMDYRHASQPVCYAICDEQKRELTGNPFDMQYRRSDCPLCKEKEG